jgi:hypothetical protein
VRLIQQRQRRHRRGADCKISKLESAGIERRHHENGADVVYDGCGGQEDAQFDRYPAPQHGDQRNRERGVGCHWHAPAVRPRPLRDDRQVQHCGYRHAAYGRGNRQRRGTPGGQMADGELALDLEAYDQREDRQQPVIDPVAQ